jgi:hypothetical protein
MARHAYEQLIAEDIAWLRLQPRCLEREHIEAALTYSVKLHYPEPSPAPTPSGEPSAREVALVGAAWATLPIIPKFLRPSALEIALSAYAPPTTEETGR